mmetsp:Transcript_4993/g.9651  ORF Transcript_4993/g.9651 Transcript_4993/m.9651 type:complete len:216 (-) Transcript_4993:63-710(-)
MAAPTSQQAGYRLPADLETEIKVSRVQAVLRGRQARASARRGLNAEQRDKLRAAQEITEAKRRFFKDVDESLGVSKGLYNASPEVQQAHVYLDTNGLPRLLEGLLARVVLEQPEDIRSFLVEALEELKSLKGQPSMGLFTNEDLDTMFSMLDELNMGKIQVSKLVETMRTLRCYPGKEQAAVDALLGANCEVVDRATFTRAVRAALHEKFAAPAA